MSETALAPEKVWDYPRPPALVPVVERLVVRHRGVTIVETERAFRVLETSHPPTFYLPPEDIAVPMTPAPGGSMCEWKGRAEYLDLAVGDTILRRAAWRYPEPTAHFAAIAGYLSIYPSMVEEAWVGETRASAQESDFYGGWITPNLTGPFKGPAGTLMW
ncbi:MAG: DUF427 domain-containing protein [Pseudomonadota bacterium]